MNIKIIWLLIICTVLSCENKNKLQVVHISSLDEEEFNLIKQSLYFTKNVEQENSIEYSSIIQKINFETDSIETVLNTESEILKFNIIGKENKSEEQFAWISATDDLQLTLHLYRNSKRLVIALEDLSALLNGFEFENSEFFLFEKTAYFDVCQDTNRYLVSVYLPEEEITVHPLGDGIGCSLHFVEKDQKIFFSFLKPLQGVTDKNSVFVQSYDIDSKRVSDSKLIHQSGNHPSFSPKFMSLTENNIILVWEKSFGSVFDSKFLYYTYLNDDQEGWSKPQKMYQSSKPILGFRLVENSSNLTALIREYDFDKKEQYLIEFNFSKSTRTVLHKFDEKVITFGELGDQYYLFLSSD